MAGAIAALHTFAADVGPEPLQLLDNNFSPLLTALNTLGTFSNYYADAGAVNAIVVNIPAPQIFALTAGVALQVKIAATNTGAVTLNAGGTGAKPVVNPDGSAMNPGQLQGAGIYSFMYDGVSFEVQGPSLGLATYKQNAAEAAAGVVPVNLSYLNYGMIDIRRYGCVGDGVTDNTATLQNAFNACAGYAIVYVPNTGNSFNASSLVNAPANTHIVYEAGAQIKWTATTATGTAFLGTATRPGIQVQGPGFRLEGRGKLTGPAVAAAGSGAGGGGVTAFVLNEMGIFVKGASASNRTKTIDVRDVEISLWGSHGICTQYCQNVYIISHIVHDVGYAGIMHLSAQTVREYFNIVYGVAPGNSGNAYGISHTHDNTNYLTDALVAAPITGITNAAAMVVTISTVSGANPYANATNATFYGVGGTTQVNGNTYPITATGGVSGAWTITCGVNSTGFGVYTTGGSLSCPRQCTNPFCIDMDCAFNTIYDIPLWNAFDAHGCYEGRYHDNASYNVHRAYQISSSSNAALGFCGEKNRVQNNVIDGRQINGNATTDGSGFIAGIVVDGGSSLINGTITAITQAANAVITINTVSGFNPFAATPIGSPITVTGAGGMTQINGLWGFITAIGGVSGAWTITVTINSGAFSAYTSGGTLGLASIPHKDVNVSGNHMQFIGHASNTPTVYCVEWSLCQGIVLQGNTFDNCVGRAFYSNNSNDYSIVGNTFGQIGPQGNIGSYCITLDTNTGTGVISGNIHSPGSVGTVYNTGLGVIGSNISRFVLNGNDFQSATTPQSGANNLTKGLSDIIPTAIDSTTGSHTFDVSIFGMAPKFRIIGNQGVASTLTDLINAPTGIAQDTDIIMVGSNTLTVNDTGGHIKLQGGTVGLTSSSVLSLRKDSNGLFQEASRAIGNT